MITRSPKEFSQALQRLQPGTDQAATPKGVFLVEPTDFYVSDETAADNLYMKLDQVADPERALGQFRDLERTIRQLGIETKVFPGNPETPDAVFPNNVFATIPGRLVIGQMRYPGRQREAEREDIPRWFHARGYETVDLRHQAGVGELTGVIVLDRARRTGYCGMTERVDEAGLEAMHQALDLHLTLAFDLVPGEYHTNVILSVLAGRACVVHEGSIAQGEVIDALEAAYPERLLCLDDHEKASFAGNCIALTENDLFMSEAAQQAFRPASRKQLEAWGFAIHSVDLSEIEKAGGSLRCMVAEIF